MHPSHDNPTRLADANGLKIAIVHSRYHESMTARLRDGAIDTFREAGGADDDLFVIQSPGSYELIAICRAIAARHNVDAIVALGCIITGETTHDRHLADAVANGLASITVRTGVPIGFGVLTCQTIEQATARAGGEHGNKGAEAMQAAIEAAGTIRSINSSGQSPDEPDESYEIQTVALRGGR